MESTIFEFDELNAKIEELKKILKLNFLKKIRLLAIFIQ